MSSPRAAEPTPDGGSATDGADETDVTGATSGPRAPSRRRVVVRWVTTVLAVLLVLFALVAPTAINELTPGAFVRIPVEALVGVALVLVLPGRARRVAAVVVGVVLGLLTILKFLDMGFFSILARPFDPVLDWSLLDDALDVLADTIGGAGAVVAAIGLGVLAVAVLVLMTLSVWRLSRVVVEHRTTAVGALAVLTPVWVICSVLGAELVPGVPVAADSASVLVRDHALQVREGLLDQEKFAQEAAVDAFRDTAPENMLTALRGKDVVFTFVESYGRSAVEAPEFAAQIDAVLDDGSNRLRAAGYASRSAWLTSPTFGGHSWLAHSTFLSGLWIDNQQRYRNLVASDRLTLTSAFKRASWETVGVMPGLVGAWPEGAFYGYDRIYDSHNIGYAGPSFSWAPMPDQFTLSAFERAEHGKPGHAPIMVGMPLVSSHIPWVPIPRLIGWDEIGDGSVYGPMATEGDSADAVWQDPARVRTEYRRSIEYTVNSLVSYVETYGNDNLVLVFLGDHQPAPIVAGDGAGHDVPITIVARDPAVMDRITGWGWEDGLKPGPQTPVWRMDAFRDKFLTAFGPQGEPAQGDPGQPSHTG